MINNIYVAIKMSLFVVLSFTIIVGLFDSTNLVSAEQIGYTLFTPLPAPGGELTHVDGDAALTTYLTVIFNIAIGMAIVFAIVMIVFGGLQYMMSDSFTSKGAARKTITDALLGLLLALSSFIILNLIGGGKLTNLEIVTREIQHAPPPVITTP